MTTSADPRQKYIQAIKNAASQQPILVENITIPMDQASTIQVKSFSKVGVKSLFYLINSCAFLSAEDKEELKNSLEVNNDAFDDMFNKLLIAEVDFLREGIFVTDAQLKLVPNDIELPIIRHKYVARLNYLVQMQNSTDVLNSPLVFNL